MAEQEQNTVTVRATRAILGLKPGEIGQVPDDDYTSAALEAGHVEKASDDDQPGLQTAQQQQRPDEGGDEGSGGGPFLS